MTYDPSRLNAGASGSSTASGGGFEKAKSRVTDGAGQAKTKVLDGFNKVVDSLEGQIHRAPADIQPAARKAVAFSRERPMATMVGLAAIALLLARGQRNRY